MQSRVCRLHGKMDIRIETEQTSEAGPGEVRLSIAAGGICGSDLHYYLDGGFGPIQVKQPIILGHEVSAVVESIGQNVTTLAIGDRVALNPSQPCGHCKYCLNNNSNHCLNMRFYGSALRYPHEQGAFRDHLVTRAELCFKLANTVSLAEGACAEPLAIAVHARNRAGNINNKKVLVTGSGPIGALCVAVARQAGASEIVVTDLADATLEIAKKMGATRTINIAEHPEDLEPYHTDKGYFDIAFECSAAPTAIASAISTVAPKGTIVQVGVSGDTPVPLNLLVGKEISLLGTHRFISEYAEAVELINRGKIDVKPIITNSFHLQEISEAFTTANNSALSSKVQLLFMEENT